MLCVFAAMAPGDFATDNLHVSGPSGHIDLTLDLDGGCRVGSLTVDSVEVLAGSGVRTGVRTRGGAYTSGAVKSAPCVSRRGDVLTVDSIVYGDGALAYIESWRFEPCGVHTGGITVWNPDRPGALRIETSAGGVMHQKFSHGKNGVFTIKHIPASGPLQMRYDLSRCVGGREDVFAPYIVEGGDTVTVRLSYVDYQKRPSRHRPTAAPPWRWTCGVRAGCHFRLCSKAERALLGRMASALSAYAAARTGSVDASVLASAARAL